MNRTTGLVLAGAVSQGAFEAGVCSVLAERSVSLRRIAATSSGALCAAVFAAGIATGRVSLAADVIEETWRDHAGWLDALDPSVRSAFSLEGLSSIEKVRVGVLDALDRVLLPAASESHPPFPGIEFRFVGTDLARTGRTSERAFSFRGSDFDTAEGRERIALCAASSAAFPGLFAPSEVDGRFIGDGGLVNNAPISYLVEPEEVDRVIVVSTAAVDAAAAATSPPRGLSLLTDLVTALIDERLFRDVHTAHRVNARLARIETALLANGSDEATRRSLVSALGLRHLDVLEVRPLVALTGNPFSGLGSAALRAAYISAGKDRAHAVLSAQGATVRA